MSDFTGEFWNIFIAVVTLVGIVGCGVLLKMNSVRRIEASQAETTGHLWDENLAEYHNPLPRWWVWLFYLTIAFSLVYLVLYPGLGRYEGAYRWSSAGQYEQEVKAAEAQFGPIYARFGSQDLKELAANAESRAIGQKLFLNYCAQCHASDAGGSRGFPNLTDHEWLWGGEPEVIKATIADGRNGVMPPFGSVLGEEGVRNAAHYVMSLSGRVHDSIRADRGKAIFAANCAACHGPDAKGNPQIGAPNLTDAVWLHGSGEENIAETITKGRNDFMPAHKEFLSEAKIHILAAYVYSMSSLSAGTLSKPAK